MKKLYLLFTAVLLTITALGQAPMGFNYQAVLRDALGNIRADAEVIIAASILQGSAEGTSIYSETHNDTTNSFGLINLEIGNGTSDGDFSTIEWATGPYFLKIVIDGIEFGTCELLSVPYAKYADKSGNTFSGEYNDLINKPELSDSTNWNDAYGWGDHEDAGYLKNETQNLSSVLMYGSNANNLNITNLADPINAQDATTKAYVDELKKQIDIIKLSLLNEIGTVWTSDTTGKVQDIDGNIYQFIKIGDQFWMTKNLITKRYSNGDSIPPGKGIGNICGELTPKYYFEHYDNLYGIFYSYYVVSDSRNVCPSGWHVPTYDELIQLTNFIQISQGSLKEVGYEHWNFPNEGAIDSHGFTALPNGYVNCDGAGFESRQRANFWSTTDYPDDNDYVWRIRLSWADNNIDIGVAQKRNVGGFAVRCIKNNY